MEIRAALGRHFVGFNTGRWDYINSVSDALAWDPAFQNPNIDADHDDLRLHAHLRGSRAAGREHARAQRPARAVAGRHGAEHPGRIDGRRRRPAMARAVAGAEREQRGGRQRQVGRALEDGAHRAAGLGAGRRGQSARPRVPAAHLHRRRRRGLRLLEPARAPCAARAICISVARAVRQRLRPGPAGRRAQAGRLLRRRRRALPDGGHGHRRDPAQHPLGVAAQAGDLHRGRRGHRRRAPATRCRRRCSPGCSTRSTPSCCAAGNRDVHDDSKATTLPIARDIVATLRRERGQAAVVHRPAEPQRSTTTTSPKPPAAIAAYMDAFAGDGTRITRNVDFDRPV